MKFVLIFMFSAQLGTFLHSGIETWGRKGVAIELDEYLDL